MAKNRPKRAGGTSPLLSPTSPGTTGSLLSPATGTGGFNLLPSSTLPGAGIPSTAAIDSTIIPILDQNGDDPYGLSQLLPNVGPGHAPQSVVQRVASVAKMPLAKQKALYSVLAQAGIVGPKKNPTTTNVQDALTMAFKQTQESGTGSLSRTINERITQVQQSGGTATTPAGTPQTGITVVPPAKVPQTVYTAADIQATADAVGKSLIGRAPNATEMAGILDLMNSASAAKTQGDVQATLATQMQNTQVQNAVQVGPGGTVSPQQVAAQIAQYGGSPMQQQVGAALVSGIESSGSPTVLAGGIGPAAGLFQFEPQTWAANGGTQFAPNAQSASWQQQVQVFVNATGGDHFGAWGPDLGASYGYSGPPKPGSKVANAIAQGNIAVNAPTGGTPSTTGGVSPVDAGLTQTRVDQGVDYAGQGQLFATGSGTVVATTNKGWPGLGTFIAVKLDNPIDPQHSVVYYAEDILPSVKAGQHVNAGDVVGTATGGHTGIEIGWGDPNAIGQALSVANGTSGQKDNPGGTPEGQHFLSYIKGLGGVSALGTGGTQGGITEVYQNPVVTDVPAMPSQQEVATNYFETQRPTEFQANNLLTLFNVIQSKFGANAGSPSNVHVRGTPLAMK